MRTITNPVYEIKELKELFPESFERAFKTYKETTLEYGAPCQSELFDSLKAVIKETGYELKYYKLSSDSGRSSITLERREHSDELTGPRAMAWIENNLFSALRIPWTGKKRNELRKYGEGYRPGMIKPCPFTGVYFDDAFIEYTRKEIKAGTSVYDTLTGLADEYARILEGEEQAVLSEEYFIDECEANEREYSEEGELI